MKKKSYFTGLTLLFLMISGLAINVYAGNFKIGMNKDDVLIWECRVCDEPEMIAIFGSGWDDSGMLQNLSKGTKMRWEINAIQINEIKMKVNFSVWFWTENTNWGLKDNDLQNSYRNDPSDYTQKLNFTKSLPFVPFWFPIPVRDYMGDLSLNDSYDVDSRVLPTLNIEIAKDGISFGFPNKYFKIIAIYNEQGILDSYKLYGKDNTVIIDIKFDFLPLYVIPMLSVLFVSIPIAIGIYLFKKRKMKVKSA
ncbi:MAG: hypothetical protein ACFFBI_06350 [Promethearchaeota archaeon]